MEQIEKKISIVVAASGEIKDVAVTEGATVGEVMREADLVGYQLTRKGGELLTPDTDIYSIAMDSEKFYATPEDVSVGVGGRAPRATLGRIKCFLSRKLAMAEELRWQRGEIEENEVKKKEFSLWGQGPSGILANYLTEHQRG